MAELCNAATDQALWSTVLREVDRNVDDPLTSVPPLPGDLIDQRCDVIATPRLVDIVWSMMRQQKVSPGPRDPRRDREADALPPTDTGDQCDFATPRTVHQAICSGWMLSSESPRASISTSRS